MSDQRQIYSTVGMPWTLLIIILFLGALSILSLFLGFDAYLSDNLEKASLYLLLGTGGFALIGYMFFRSKSLMEKVEIIPKLEVVTTLECPNCGLKKIRPFQQGDYLFKEDEECTRCKGKMVVTKIYGREKPKQ
jgi:hypothetical protein